MSRTTFFEVEILDAKTKRQFCFLDKVEPQSTIADIKALFHKSYPQWYPARQALKLHPMGNQLKDDEVLQNLPVGTTAVLYFRDLGPQLGWTMVFMSEYAGPLLIYLLFYFRLPHIYAHKYAFSTSPHPVVSLACACHTFHYIKRLVETIFVHRFSHGTMPLKTIIRNCVYYWGFSAWLAYYINHPLYTPPSFGERQVNYAIIIFALCEAGNFSIHWSLSSLKGGVGAKCRRFPHPSKNPFTWLFFFVSCPNYTYEVGVWVGFSIMTQCVPVVLFTLIGFVQMTIWAKGKHRAYTREFKDYPTFRMPILPFVL
ncbi:very-long-chain enoyl-CoA reductase isoform X1 [Electrophorus electricus]|uniref:very-long-chain enoyl-CoA reductase isoform X1 n=1 Tax=Electrophorus electricus TaxID=8005 RepID=UPI0015CFA6CC|nr:very-long-chain enoyl-CoA reductase isoform X1 [Electrophorus electricus]